MDVFNAVEVDNVADVLGSDEVDEIFVFAVLIVLVVVVLIRFVAVVVLALVVVIFDVSGALVVVSFCAESSFMQTSEIHIMT